MNPGSPTACGRCAAGDHGKCRDERAMGTGWKGARCGCCYPDVSAAERNMAAELQALAVELERGSLVLADILPRLRGMVRGIEGT